MSDQQHRTKTRRRPKSVSGLIFDIFNYLFIILFCISVLFPLWDLIVVSFSRAEDISVISTNLWPKVWDAGAYEFVFSNPVVWMGLKNSVLRTLIGTVYHLLVCSLAAYALTRKKMPFLKPITVIFLITMFFSGGMIPVYLNMKNLGLLDNFLVYILPTGFSMYNTLIIRNYFLSIDKSLEESATIDGASMLQTMFLIILPLSKPVLATVALWQMVGQWNAWFDNMIYVRPERLITIQYYLRRLSSNVAEMQDKMTMMGTVGVDQTAFSYTPETVIAATTIITIVPIIVTYPFLQKYFVGGIMVGAVKG